MTRAQADRARALLRGGDARVVPVLVGEGVDARKAVDVASRLSGIPLLPDKWLKSPKPPLDLPAPREAWRELRATPVGTLRGQLCIAFSDPEDATSPAAHELPEHRAFLATESDIARIFKIAMGGPSGGTAPASTKPKLPAAAAHDTVVEQNPFLAPSLPSGAMQALPVGGDTMSGSLHDDVAPTVRLPAADARDPNATLAIEPPSVVSRLPPRDPSGKSRATGERGSALDDARERALAALPRFRVRGVLGRGGMATVYLVDDLERGKKVALKLMEPHLAEDETFVERFRREVRSTSSLDHPNVVRLFDSGAEGDALYMAQEYVDGGTLRDLLVQTGPMPAALVAPIMWQALEGLHHAHEKGLVHRDLKPANILLSLDGEVKVGDFGVAKSQTDNTLTQSGMLFGTPAYMSPEQAFGKTLDGRSDLFSLSTLAYELLTGRNPYHHENMSTSLLMVSKVQARPVFEAVPTLPPLFEEVLARMMERERGERYRDAKTAADKLKPLVEAISARHGNVIAEALRDPPSTTALLVRAQADEETRRAQVLLARPEPPVREAAFRLFKATRLDPHNPAARSFLGHLVQQHGFRFDLEPDAKLEEIEDALSKKPGSPALLRRGADLMLGRNNLLGAAVWMRRYVRAQPGDHHMEHSLNALIGSDALAPFSAFEDAPASLPVDPTKYHLPEVVLPEFDRAPRGAQASSDGAASYVRSGDELVATSNKGKLIAAAIVVVIALAIVLPAVLGVGRGSGKAQGGDDPAPDPSQNTSAPVVDDLERIHARHAEQRRKLDDGRRLAEQGQLAEAVARLDAAIELDPGSDGAVDALLARARAYANLRRFAEARTDLEKVKKLVELDDPRQGEADRLLEGLSGI